MQGVLQVQIRLEPQGIDLWQTHLNLRERFSPPLLPKKEKGVLSRGQTGVPYSSKEELQFQLPKPNSFVIDIIIVLV